MATRLFFYSRLLSVVALLAFFSIALPVYADTLDSVAQRRADLQSELNALSGQIAVQQAILEQKHGQTASLQRDLDILSAQIQKSELSIKARDISIQQLTGNIGEKNNTLTSLSEKLIAERQSLAEILRKTNMIDQATMAELLLSSGSLSTFYEDLNAFAQIQGALQQSFKEITDTKTATVVAKTDLEEKRAEEQELRQQQIIQRNQVKANKVQQATLIAASKAQESQYQSVIQATKKVVAQIEAELFTLRDTAPIPFSQALAYAQAASQKTGVPPAFILGILKQESDLGANVGACYVTSLSTGDGIGKNTGKFFSGVMKSPRDTVPFQSITGGLGIPWATAPVSCPSGGGYGGAMGPSQFIPSTWQLYATRLGKALGIATPNPWNAKDAIMATALYLDDIGAGKGTYAAERNAACKYYSGRSCDNRKPANQFYGDSVMDNASYFQNQIDLVNGA